MGQCTLIEPPRLFSWALPWWLVSLSVCLSVSHMFSPSLIAFSKLLLQLFLFYSLLLKAFCFGKPFGKPFARLVAHWGHPSLPRSTLIPGVPAVAWPQSGGERRLLSGELPSAKDQGPKDALMQAPLPERGDHGARPIWGKSATLLSQPLSVHRKLICRKVSGVW